MSDQNTETPNADPYPEHPKLTGNDRTDSVLRHQFFAEGVRWFERNKQAGLTRNDSGVTVSAAPASVATPDAADAELVMSLRKEAMITHRVRNSALNALVEKAHMDVLAGRALDREALEAAYGEAIATPESRATAKAVETLSKVVDSEGNVAHSAIPRELLHGFSLPAGTYRAAETIALLKQAAELGLTDEQVAKYIAMTEE